MFAQIYGQDHVVDLLQQELVNDELPQALLFSGERWSGRMTAALETARIIHCSQGGVPACRCSSCRASRTLEHPYTMVFANRSFLPLIEASIAACRQGSADAGELLKRSVHILMRRFDSHWNLQEKDFRDQLEELAEILRDAASREVRPGGIPKGQIESIRKLSRKLAEGIKSENIPIHAIRSLQSWLSTKPKNQSAVVILEGVEQFSSASKNGLLKFLEEPPAKVTVILLSEGQGRILPTILSRVRKYPFAQRGDDAAASVIRDVYYMDPEEYDSLETFFLTQSGVDCRSVREDAEFLVETLFQPREYDHQRLCEILARLDKQNLVRRALQELTDVLREYRESGQLDAELEYSSWQAVSACSREITGKHQRESVIFESCYYRLAEIWKYHRGNA